MHAFQSYLTMLQNLRKQRKYPALMTHVVLGYPSLRESIEIVKVMADSGAALIELQIPFSDPMADGPTIMAANEAALRGGVTVKDCFVAAEKLHKVSAVPLIFMSYFNILFRYHCRTTKGGVRQFCEDAADAGIQGLIVADIPPEEEDEGYWSYTKEAGICAIPIISPLSEEKRLKLIGPLAREGFAYCVSTTGTTGTRGKLPSGLVPYLRNVRKQIQAPLAVGFGISNASQVKSLAPVADIAIVGSAMIETISKTPARKRSAAVQKFTRELSGL